MPQDYATLAAQLGGAPAEAPVDVAALAAELGGVADAPAKTGPLWKQLEMAEGGQVMPVLPGLSVVGQVNPLQQAIAAGAGRLAEGVKNQATKLVLSHVKPRYTELQRRAGIEGSTPTVVAKRIARFMVDHGLSTSQKAQDLVKASGQQVDDAIAQAEAANPNLALDTAKRVPRYIGSLARRIEHQILPGKDRAAVQGVAKEVLEDSPLSAGQRLRVDVKPSEGTRMVREKSFFDPQASGATIAGGKTIERAVRDAIKQAVPETRAPLMRQGRAMDATRLLERGEHLAQNRDTLGGFAQTMGLAGNLRGLLAQLLKESQLRIGAGAAPRVARALERTGNMDPAALQAAIAQLLAVSHDQE